MPKLETITPIPSGNEFSGSQSLPLRVKTRSGMQLEALVDGSKQTSKDPLDPDNKRWFLKRKGVDLLALRETVEPQVILNGYFESQDAMFSGQDWVFVEAASATGSATSEAGLVSSGDMGCRRWTRRWW